MHKLLLLILTLVGIYSLYSALVILLRHRSLLNHPQTPDDCRLQRTVAELHARSANVRQFLGTTFCLFGFVFFFGLRFALGTGESNIPVGILVLRNFFLYFALAANVFLVFLILHSVHWYVLSRLQANALRHNPTRTT